MNSNKNNSYTLSDTQKNLTKNISKQTLLILIPFIIGFIYVISVIIRAIIPQSVIALLFAEFLFTIMTISGMLCLTLSFIFTKKKYKFFCIKIENNFNKLISKLVITHLK